MRRFSQLVLGAALFALCCAPPLFAQAADDPNPATISGKVAETMDSGGYTYVLLEQNGKQTWAALPQTKITPGQEITIASGMVMEKFESKTLNRTFDAIIFSPGLAGGEKAGAAPVAGGKAPSDDFHAALKAEAGASPAPAEAGDEAAMGQVSGGSASAIVPAVAAKVEKAEGANGYTVSEIFEKRKELDGKTVQVRGKVVKFSPMIMGKNWVHLQDGTGNPMVNSHDLVLTTMAAPANDAIVVLEGTVHADKDFGAGYRYDVIVEDAALK